MIVYDQFRYMLDLDWWNKRGARSLKVIYYAPEILTLRCELQFIITKELFSF